MSQLPTGQEKTWFNSFAAVAILKLLALRHHVEAANRTQDGKPHLPAREDSTLPAGTSAPLFFCLCRPTVRIKESLNMELRDLMTDAELYLRKAREDFDRAAHGACRKHLGDLYVLLLYEIAYKARKKSEFTYLPSPTKESP